MYNTEEITKQILSLGAARVCSIKTQQLCFDEKFRKSCESNVCGNFNAHYMCPPCTGTPQELIQKAKSYKEAVVFCITGGIKGFEDKEGMEAIQQQMQQLTDKVHDYAAAQNFDFTIAAAANCKKCIPCGFVTGKACPNKDKTYPSLSAYCIDVAKLAQSCNIQLDWSGNTMTYYAVLFLK